VKILCEKKLQTFNTSYCKRDWDIIREILQKTEELQPGKTLSSYDFQEEKLLDVNYNAVLLSEAGLIELKGVYDELGNLLRFRISKLTWDGHEFLDAIKSESIWKKTKEKIIEKGGAMTFDVVKAVALGLIKTSLEL